MNQFAPYIPLLEQALRKLDAWRSQYGEDSSDSSANSGQIEDILGRLTEHLEGNYPFHHPSYAGQMLKPPHPVAWLAYALTATINPNNHALDGGPPTSEMEKEAVRELAKMVGYGDTYLGHLTSGGTIANLEALFVAREIHPKKSIAATSNAHYTHSRMCHVLNTKFLEIPVDVNDIPDFNFIENHAEDIGTIVVTMGTTGLGTTEPLSKILDIAAKHSIRIHVDAAYGGFFSLIKEDLPKKEEWEFLSEADSIVIDPHKHGLQPYGCGSILYKDPSVGKYYKHDSPYTYFTSEDLHLGEISLECSRAGASAAAFWATLQMLPLTETGLGAVLKKAREAAVQFSILLKESSSFQLYQEPDLDIVGYFRIPEKTNTSEINKLSHSLFEKGMNQKNPADSYHLSLYKIPADRFIARFPNYRTDTDYVQILRSVFMKEEHAGFVNELADRIGI
ncbi:pyridoxal phosphate-dependent decarboxylase family protein [Rhodohalobacter sp.]|uniref:pyridoxal phosphate-dependent decarboxylase family protein n=1 Tax=Rhodohalobacter sp. TaxID=1974210 RepID=UPI002ACD275B|nr:aminotransferase class I/II-fold pyridoxal phosphate-dependent enzyme [Rhodohalobacter sp.]MDZ7758382.1 aminotransferase class I/II-fold pyridoxal phosphate-dependent enzyme [Rhodohalobacter sp.]